MAQNSVQALDIALRMIGAEIYTSDYHKFGNLFVEAPGRGYGFPVPATIRDLLIGDDKKLFLRLSGTLATTTSPSYKSN